jgi:hypothetical protein
VTRIYAIAMTEDGLSTYVEARGPEQLQMCHMGADPATAPKSIYKGKTYHVNVRFGAT